MGEAGMGATSTAEARMVKGRSRARRRLDASGEGRGAPPTHRDRREHAHRHQLRAGKGKPRRRLRGLRHAAASSRGDRAPPRRRRVVRSAAAPRQSQDQAFAHTKRQLGRRDVYAWSLRRTCSTRACTSHRSLAYGTVRCKSVAPSSSRQLSASRASSWSRAALTRAASPHSSAVARTSRVPHCSSICASTSARGIRREQYLHRPKLRLQWASCSAKFALNICWLQFGHSVNTEGTSAGGAHAGGALAGGSLSRALGGRSLSGTGSCCRGVNVMRGGIGSTTASTTATHDGLCRDLVFLWGHPQRGAGAALCVDVSFRLVVPEALYDLFESTGSPTHVSTRLAAHAAAAATHVWWLPSVYLLDWIEVSTGPPSGQSCSCGSWYPAAYARK